jgi:ribosomal protein L14E/L6E/L27E
MNISKADIVQSTAGRDEGKLFFVLAAQGDFLLLADGKGRKVETPKRKSSKHVTLVAQGEGAIAEKIKSSEKVTNSELRKAIAALGGGNLDQEG